MPMIRVSKVNKELLEAMEIGSMNRTVSELMTYYNQREASKSVLTSDDLEEIRNIISSEIDKLRAG